MADTNLANAYARQGNDLWQRREFASCLLAFDMACRAREELASYCYVKVGTS
jgi:hypothetical protein